MSKIATDTTATLLALFAGQTVSHHDIGAQIELAYAADKRRCTFGSHMQVLDALDRAGVVAHMDDSPALDHTYTFPAA